MEPRWSPGGVLHFVSDHTGWWNLYRWQGGAVEPLYPAELEFGRPCWSFGTTTYGFLGPKRIVCTPLDNGKQRLSILEDGRLTPLATPFETSSTPLPFGERLAMTGASDSDPGGLILLEPMWCVSRRNPCRL